MDEVRRDHEFEMVLVPFELRPTMLPEGLDMGELQAEGHSSRVEEHLRRVAEKEGFALVLPDFLPSTHKALTVAEVGRDQGDAMHQEAHRAVFDAYFGRGLDIGDETVLLEVASGVGLDRDTVERAWREDTYGERLHQFRHVALQLGIDATPATLVCNELIIGSRPAAVMREALERCGLHVHEGGEAVES